MNPLGKTGHPKVKGPLFFVTNQRSQSYIVRNVTSGIQNTDMVGDVSALSSSPVSRCMASTVYCSFFSAKGTFGTYISYTQKSLGVETPIPICLLLESASVYQCHDMLSKF